MKQAEAVDDNDDTERPWWLYLVRCGDGSLYTGISKDVPRRLAEHGEGGGRGARYLRGRGPLQLAYRCRVGDRSLALRLERRVKRLSAVDKRRLAAHQPADIDAWLKHG